MMSKTKIVLCLMVLVLTILSVAPLAAQSDNPLAQDGPYGTGVRIVKITDESREDRTLKAYIWYPSSDVSGGPYPLIIYSHGYNGNPSESSGFFANHLVSQGFVVAGVDHQDTNDVAHALVNRPLDVLFLLNYLANLKGDDPLAGVIDTTKVGLVGYSAGSYTSLVAAGVRVDPASLPDWCAGTPDITGVDYCHWVLPGWTNAQAYHDQLVPASDDGLWSATTDDRIQAVAVFAPCFGYVMGERGLAAMTLPVMIFAGTSDETCPYNLDATYINQHLGSSDRYFLTLDGRTHSTVVARDVIKPYLSAFFGLYLKGETDDAQYLTPDTAAAYDKVTLEVHLGKSSFVSFHN